MAVAVVIRRGPSTRFDVLIIIWVVYGSRGFGSHSAYSFWYVIGNKAVTTVANVLFNAYIADLETCFKLTPLDLLRALNITTRGFGMETEITGKLLARGVRPFEVRITCRARTREAGKKITWRDGVQAVRILARIRMTQAASAFPGQGCGARRGPDDVKDLRSPNMHALTPGQLDDRSKENWLS